MGPTDRQTDKRPILDNALFFNAHNPRDIIPPSPVESLENHRCFCAAARTLRSAVRAKTKIRCMFKDKMRRLLNFIHEPSVSSVLKYDPVRPSSCQQRSLKGGEVAKAKTITKENCRYLKGEWGLGGGGSKTRKEQRPLEKRRLKNSRKREAACFKRPRVSQQMREVAKAKTPTTENCALGHLITKSECGFEQGKSRESESPKESRESEGPNKVSAKNENTPGLPARLKILAQVPLSLKVLPTPSSPPSNAMIVQGSAL